MPQPVPLWCHFLDTLSEKEEREGGLIRVDGGCQSFGVTQGQNRDSEAADVCKQPTSSGAFYTHT